MTSARLRWPGIADVVVTLQGERVIVDEGEERRVQTLGSSADAQAHFERIVKLRRKEGYTLVESREDAAEFVAPDALELLGFDGEVEVTGGRLAITFGDIDGERTLSLAVCQALVDRVVREGPRRVDVLCEEDSPGALWQQALVGVTLGSVEAFVLDVFWQTQAQQRERAVGDIGAVLDACPGLLRMFCTGDLTLTPRAHASLRELHLAGDPLSLACVAALGRCSLPGLERLVLSLASDAGPLDDAAVLEAVLTLRAPRLREVHLADIDDVPAFVSRLAARGVPGAWRVLSLAGTWDGAYDGDDVQPALEAAGAAFRGLEALVLAVDEEEASRLTAFAPVRGREAVRSLFLPDAYQAW